MRQIARVQRSAIPQSIRKHAALAISRRGLGFTGRAPGVAAAYYPFRDELDCLPLLTRLDGEGWRTALPAAALAQDLG
ncbi:MAG: hypothetical protein HC850_07195, partial [Rhodomicrobium sp.]|nr:hypothetical protein [Rhodomicrobium sp.]